jgi:hypothetical protein
MPAYRTPRWTPAELEILQAQYPEQGIDVAEQLPGRTWHSIHVKAHKLGLKTRKVGDAPRLKLAGAELEEAIGLREGQRWSFARIGAKFGISEGSANNAVLIALCARRGFKPAERDDHGHLTERGLERVRYALKKGLKGVDIQLRLGVSASCVAEQRRRYNRDLLGRGKAALPPPGAGEAYSGVKLSKGKIAAVERLFLDGLGTAKASERSGVSKTSCTRIRNRLIKRLKRKGELLPGCDAQGVRRVQAESTRLITDAQRDALRSMLLERIPVSRAANIVAIGGSSAYRIRDELAAEMAAAGERLPPPERPGRVRPNAFVQSHWPPKGNAEIFAFRQLLRDLTFDDAKVAWRRRKQEAARAEAERPKSFEEQLALVASGKLKLSTSMSRAHLEPQYREERRAQA